MYIRHNIGGGGVVQTIYYTRRVQVEQLRLLINAHFSEIGLITTKMPILVDDCDQHTHDL